MRAEAACPTTDPLAGLWGTNVIETETMNPRHISALLLTISLLSGLCGGSSAPAQGIFGEQEYDYALSDVLPAGEEFVRKETYWEAYGPTGGRDRALVGYVLLSDDLVETPGYSGHTLNTLVGLDPEGVITGIRIVRHSEPIVLIGLAEKVIHDFVAQYLGRSIRDRILVSDTPDEGYVGVDGISGATVTAIAENTTILEAGRRVAKEVGLLSASDLRTRRPSGLYEPKTWEELSLAGAIGHLIVAGEEVQLPPDSPALDLHFAVLDPPTVGRNLLGERFYAVVEARLAEQGGSAIFIGASGAISFKGAGFARGGIFDRFSLEQGDGLFVFQDVDYINFNDLEIEDGPELSEGGIFFIEEESFDPTAPVTVHVTLPYRVNDKRQYGTFLTQYQLPEALVIEEIPFWKLRWQDAQNETVALGVLLLTVAVLFGLRQRLLPWRKLLHYCVATISVVWVGFMLKAQPSMTQVLTLSESASRGRFPLEIYLSEPLSFIFWIVIVASLAVWGRGFFCGWLCPYGALLELAGAVWRKVAPKSWVESLERLEPGQGWKFLKYATFGLIATVAFYDLTLAETLNEIEPFKTYILRFDREILYVGYFAVMTLLSAFVYRFFCRFVCPLGGGLAIPSLRPAASFKRYEQCGSCRICAKGCEPKAISQETGRIDYRECLQCWDCQSWGADEANCPELILAKRENRAPRKLAGTILGAFGVLAALAGEARAETREIHPGPQAVQEAIFASADGDTLWVGEGVHTERDILVDRRIVLVGRPGAIIDGGGTGHILVIDAPGVRVEGLTLRNTGNDPMRADSAIRVEEKSADVELVGNTIVDTHFGIWVHGSARVRLEGNTLAGRPDVGQNQRGDCIHLWSTKAAVVRGNNLTHCRDGIYMELSMDTEVIANEIRDARYSLHTMWCDRSSYNENVATGNLVGLALMFSKRIEAKGNTLYDNATHGILLTQVTRAQVEGNRIIGNTKGLFVYNSLYNRIEKNLLARNRLGMHYWGGSEDNEIVENSFMDNEIQVKFVASRDQTWNDNYWSDYSGWDANGDARGDVPYRSNTLVDALLWAYPAAKLLLSSPGLQALAWAERSFPVITVPKGIDHRPWMSPTVADWRETLAQYPPTSQNYYGDLSKLPHIPGEH